MLSLYSAVDNYEPNHVLFTVHEWHNDLTWLGVGGSVIIFIRISVDERAHS